MECDKESFFIKSNTENNHNDNLYNKINEINLPWICVKDSISKEGVKGYRLNLNDIIKIGRIKLRIKEIKMKNYIHSNHIFNNSDIKGKTENNIIKQTGNEFYTTYKKGNDKKKSPTCRICYCTEEEIESDLIQPCICSGSMKYIHYTCLQQWLKSKGFDKKTTTATSISYNLKAIECELCKTTLPEVIIQNNKKYDLFGFIKPDFENYIVFELISSTSSSVKNFYSVDITLKDSLKLGRGQESDIRISDISVSRNHAFIEVNLKTGYLNIIDNNAKFGTLVFVFNKKMKLLLNQPLTIQIGRSLIKFQLYSTCLKFFSCSSNNKTKKQIATDYQLLNYQHVISDSNNDIVKIISSPLHDETESSIVKSNIDNHTEMKYIEIENRYVIEQKSILKNIEDKSGFIIKDSIIEHENKYNEEMFSHYSISDYKKDEDKENNIEEELKNDDIIKNRLSLDKNDTEVNKTFTNKNNDCQEELIIRRKVYSDPN